MRAVPQALVHHHSSSHEDIEKDIELVPEKLEVGSVGVEHFFEPDGVGGRGEGGSWVEFDFGGEGWERGGCESLKNAVWMNVPEEETSMQVRHREASSLN